MQENILKPREAVDALREVARRGFNSEPVQGRHGGRLRQRVEFEAREKAALRRFLGGNQGLAAVGVEPTFSLFGERRFTLSLLERLVYAMDGDDIGPSYVAALAAELEQVVEARAGLFEAAELERMARMTAPPEGAGR